MEIGFFIIFICNILTTGLCVCLVNQNIKLRKQFIKAKALLNLQNICLQESNKILANINKEGEQK